ncbi:MAG TPA: nucleoside hydrolase [Candidatus Acidoferrales bacterium]|nr:nucleoside hydrolase [Candidatus Acidoferrales bacterium]
MIRTHFLLFLAAVYLLALPSAAQQKPKIIIDEDALGPATTNLQAILALIQSPQTQVLGITVVSGDGWRDENVAHTLRMLEIIGRTDIPVVPGAVFPLKNSPQFIAAWEKRYGKVTYQGAWNWPPGKTHGPFEVPPLIEGEPHTAASTEDAAHFLVRMVHLYPHQVTIYAGGPLTDLALAITIDPHFAELAEQLVVMGGSIHPQTTDPEFLANPHREFNFWMDPEAAHAVLKANWPRITDTTVDISVKTRLTKQMIAEIAKSNAPAAQYIAKYAAEDYMWDELAAIALLDPSIITRTEKLYLDASTDPGPTYGNTLTWPPGNLPSSLVPNSNIGKDYQPPTDTGCSGGCTGLNGPPQPVFVNVELDTAKFYQDFVSLMSRPTPKP